MKSFKEFNESGLWANIHKKRKEGRPMRKKGAKGAPTKQDIERSRNEATVDEGPLVMLDGEILNSIWKKVKPELEKMMRKGQLEVVNNLARIAKYKVTKSNQAKGKTYRYDLKK
jgi:hypothetical protein